MTRSSQSWQVRSARVKVLLVLMSLSLSAALFVTLDFLYSRVIKKATGNKLRLHSPPPAGASPIQTDCTVRDPVRHHAYRPKCAAVIAWGKDSHDFFTNNLGFRDERIREVPRTDPRPRFLLLGDSFTVGMLAWPDTFVARTVAAFPQYDFLNGGVSSYSPSNYLNQTRMVLASGVEFDEAIVFLDISDAQDEAAYYRDIDSSGAVTGPGKAVWTTPWFEKIRLQIRNHLLLTNFLIDWFERKYVSRGHYHLFSGQGGDLFDLERSAWTYRKVSDTKGYGDGYAPLGLESGITKEETKMTLLWQELAKRKIPLSVVVYPWPAQVVHDGADSPQVRMWSEWCAGKCKWFLSLFSAFRAAKDRCPQSEPGCWYLRYFVFGDVHYNSAGNALVADAVIRSLEETPPVKLRGIPASTPTSTRPAKSMRKQ